MTEIEYFLVDVFTSKQFGGNQLAVFIDFEDLISDENMLKMARELNLAEITFIKKNDNNQNFDVRIFTPEYEVPFAGHPSLGTAFVISKYLLPKPNQNIGLNLKHATITINLSRVDDIDKSYFTMEQAQPKFTRTFKHKEIAEGLGIPLDFLDSQKPIEEITTGLPYIIIPITNLESINQLNLNSQKIKDFLIEKKLYKTNSKSKLTTSLFFVTEETFEKENNFNARMFCLENESLVEDAATGSANGCFLAYLLKNKTTNINAIVEQGFKKGRKSYIHLNGHCNNKTYNLQVAGQVVDVAKGYWKL